MVLRPALYARRSVFRLLLRCVSDSGRCGGCLCCSYRRRSRPCFDWSVSTRTRRRSYFHCQRPAPRRPRPTTPACCLCLHANLWASSRRPTWTPCVARRRSSVSSGAVLSWFAPTWTASTCWLPHRTWTHWRAAASCSETRRTFATTTHPQPVSPAQIHTILFKILTS